MLEESALKNYQEKINFVKDLSEVVSKYHESVAKLEYRVLENTAGYIDEFLFVHYAGGAIAVRDCNWDSIRAIFDEVNHYLISGAPRDYYDGYARYQKFIDQAHEYKPVEGLTE